MDPKQPFVQLVRPRPQIRSQRQPLRGVGLEPQVAARWIAPGPLQPRESLLGFEDLGVLAGSKGPLVLNSVGLPELDVVGNEPRLELAFVNAQSVHQPASDGMCTTVLNTLRDTHRRPPGRLRIGVDAGFATLIAHHATSSG